MKTLDLIQGSELWHQVRLQHFTASEAPAMMGASKYQTRDALLKLKATGIAKEVSERTQRLFNKGHETEASIRPFIESILGDELYPVTGSIEIEGLKLLGSFDGLTMMEDKGFEHKFWNEELAASVRAEDLHPHYYWQLEQLLLISGAEYMLFATSNGTGEQCVWMKYYPVAGRREELIAGWKQFAIDLANYVLPEAEAPAAVAELMPALPTISYSTQFTGTTLALRSNLEDFKVGVAKLSELSKLKLETDQDFANAIARVKICEDAEARIALVKSMVIGEVASIDMFTKELDALDKVLSQIRLGDKKQVDKRKEEIKLEVITNAQAQWAEHLNLINKKLDGVTLPHVTINLQGAIKNLRTISSLKSKANDELARAKIEANQLAEKITNNIQLLRMIAGEYMELFADLQTICVKDADYIKAIAKQRVDQHKADEQARIQAEAQRIANEQIEKDRQAELAKAQAAAVEAVKPLEAEVQPVREQQLDLVNSIHAEYEQQNNIPAFVPAERPMYVATNEAQEELAEVFVDLSDFQKGFNAGRIAGLDLALAIFIKHGSSGFAKAVEDFIEVGAPEAQSKAA